MFGTGNDIDCQLQQELVPVLLERRKTVEIRLYKGKWMHITAGSLIRVNEKHIFLVTAVRYWDNFNQALYDCGFNKALPDAQSHEDAVKFYESLYGAESDLKECVVSMEIKLLAPSH